MIKFLYVSNAPNTGQLISVNGIKNIGTTGPTATTVTIDYVDGTTTTVTTAAQVASDVYVKIKNGVESALTTSWTNPYYDIVSPKAVTSIVNA